MNQMNLLDWTPPDSDRFGASYVRTFDYKRLNAQQRRVWDVMADGVWRTLREISAVTGDPEASISARLRDLRRPEFGGFRVDRRRRGDPKHGINEYQVLRGA